MKTWRLSGVQADIDSVPVDTVLVNFHSSDAVSRFSIANAYQGNLGTPLQTKLYLERPVESQFMFSDAYQPYIRQISNTTFYNTKTPFSSLKYLSGGTNHREEDEVGFLFTVNASKKLNFGTSLDYIYARGEYAQQSVKRFEGSFFGSYQGRKYDAFAALSTNTLKHFENGGITSAEHLINLPEGFTTSTIPVKFTDDVQGTYKHTQLFFNQKFSVGFEKEHRDAKDSIIKDFIPVTRFVHTLQFDNMSKRYYERISQTDFYQNTYWSNTSTQDTSAYNHLMNHFSVNMLEEFNKWMHFGLSAYIENHINQYAFQDDTGGLLHYLESNTKVGSRLSKQQGKKLTYMVGGDLTLFGPRTGDFKLYSDLGSAFRLWKDTIALKAKGFIQSEEPSFFIRQYASNHFKWTTQFSKTYKTHLGGEFSIPTRNFRLNVGVENVTGLIYFNKQALPSQFGGNVQVVVADLNQDFHLGAFTLENKIVYQLSSQQEILPLPTFCLNHNLYFQDKWFKVVSVQLGTGVSYHTKYFVPKYMPATNQFYVQDELEVGGFPIMNVYANFHLKRTRIFLQYYHMNELFMKQVYYSMPDYPINQAVFKIGLTWNFYD